MVALLVCRRRTRPGVVAAAIVLAVVSTAAAPAFLQSPSHHAGALAGQRSRAHPNPRSRGRCARAGAGWAGWAAAAPDSGAASWRLAGGQAAALLVAVLLGIAAPQPASGSLLSEFGRPDYDEQARQNQFAKSRAKVLEDASSKQQGRAAAKIKEAEEKAKVEALLRKYDTESKAKEAKKEARAKKLDAIREGVLSGLKAKEKTGDDKVSVAEGLLEKYSQQEREKEAASEARAKKAEEVRQKILGDLSKRRLDALKAAEEAEKIAQRIEELAKSARQTAEAARLLADLSN